MNPSSIEITGTVLFCLAVVHTFLTKWFHSRIAHYRDGSLARTLFRILGEVELVFGLWAAVFLGCLALLESPSTASQYLESMDFRDPLFVFVVLVICSSRPVLDTAEIIVGFFAKFLPLPRSIAYYITALVLGPALGSFITEPAAMTLIALTLFEKFYHKDISMRFKYATLGLLFVNVSISGTLAPYAAPPVLMVAARWNLGLSEMFFRFGWKGVLSALCSTFVVCFRFRKEFSHIEITNKKPNSITPLWLKAIHLICLFGVIYTAHSVPSFIGMFLLFLGLVITTQKFQSSLYLREGLLITLFLGGLIILGSPQKWWLEPLLSNLSPGPLYLGAIGLTAFIDNAALTYLGSLVTHLTDESKYLLLAGAVVGGGLTVIANAPNLIGFNILTPTFGKDGIDPLKLFAAAVLPTIISALCFFFL